MDPGHVHQYARVGRGPIANVTGFGSLLLRAWIGRKLLAACMQIFAHIASSSLDNSIPINLTMIFREKKLRREFLTGSACSNGMG